jgi:glycosyltransferase involved in cell wall biosynthesis
MTEIYNPLGVLEIFAEIRRRYPGSRLLMNAAGELGEQVKARIRELELADDIEFLTDIPSWDRLPDIYSRSDVMLLPARFSNGNFSQLEAMASGMGMVISDEVLGIGTMIEDGHNGFRCFPDTASFVDRVERYIADPALFARHAAINRPMVAPLSSTGTARFFSEKIRTFFGAKNEKLA